MHVLFLRKWYVCVFELYVCMFQSCVLGVLVALHFPNKFGAKPVWAAR